MKNKILIINHVFWPDKLNTARHISELAEELVLRGWDVTALITNRSYVDNHIKIKPSKGIWNGVKYKRVYLPPFNQKSNIQRIVTSIWLIVSWSFRLSFIGKYDAIILGTNPPFSYLLTPILKLFKRNSKILLWGFDLYPEAIIASGSKLWKSIGSLIKPLTKGCYNKLDVIVDIGSCMRTNFQKYNHKAKEVTLPPWSFVEFNKLSALHLETRKALFGDADLTLLYSGTIGNAHEFDNFLILARELKKRKASIGFCFAGFGNKFKELKSQIKITDSNISFGGFVNTDKELEHRLSSADLMLISLKDEWTGISVPSKYFGAIATGKAVIFSGSDDSSLCKWTKKYNMGFHLTENNISEIADTLCEIELRPELIRVIQQNALTTYKKHFSKKIICDKWSELLTQTIG